MVEVVASATQVQNNFGRYLNMVINGQEIVLTKNGKEVGRILPKLATVSYLTDSLTGILKQKTDDTEKDRLRRERLSEKYGL